MRQQRVYRSERPEPSHRSSSQSRIPSGTDYAKPKVRHLTRRAPSLRIYTAHEYCLRILPFFRSQNGPGICCLALVVSSLANSIAAAVAPRLKTSSTPHRNSRVSTSQYEI